MKILGELVITLIAGLISALLFAASWLSLSFMGPTWATTDFWLSWFAFFAFVGGLIFVAAVLVFLCTCLSDHFAEIRRMFVGLLVCGVAAFAADAAKAKDTIVQVEHQADGTTITWLNGYHSAIISGRKLQPWTKKINPVWWYKNDFEPVAPSWYKPGEAQWWRQFSWYMRNPFQNAGRYVFGIADRNYRVDGPIDLRQGGDLIGTGKTGCFRLKFTHISGLRSGAQREFVSCTGKRTIWYAGTQWTGFYGFKWNMLNSNFQAW